MALPRLPMVTSVYWSLVAILLGLGNVEASCQLRCGVLLDQRGPTSLFEFTQTVWTRLKHEQGLQNIDMLFVEVQAMVNPSIDSVMDEYMEIGHKNVSSLIGAYAQAVAAASQKIGSPYLVTEDIGDKAYRPPNMLSVAPRENDIRRITVDTLTFYQWAEVALFYDGPRGSAMVQTLALDPELRVRAWRLDPDMTPAEIRASLLYVRQMPLTNIILLAANDTTSRVLDEALKLSMLSNRYTWLLPTLDANEDMLLGYAYTQVKLLTFDLSQTSQSMSSVFSNSDSARYFNKFEYAMVHDSLLVLYHVFDEFRRKEKTCSWPRGGAGVLAATEKLHLTGMTGQINIGADGRRYDYGVKLVGFGERSLTEMGRWNSSLYSNQNLYINQTAVQTNHTLEYPMGKTVVRVVTILERPFVQFKKDYFNYSSDERLEGYCVDLLDALSTMLGFQYELYLVPDGTWDGLIEEVTNGNASMIVASLTITSKREQVIDFSKPFKTLGISVVMKRPSSRRTVFEFMLPLSEYVWLLLVATVLVASVTFYVIHRLLPTDSYGFHFGLQQSVWFTIASLFRRDTDVISISVAAKIATGVLWFASIIVMSSFTANWAAHLTLSQFHSPIQSVSDLIEQSKVKYGTVRNTQVSSFFRNSKLSHLEKMWQFMSSVDPTIMVNTSEEGMDKMKNSDGEYAFLWDSPVIEYEVNENCDLMSIGQAFDSRGYGIGVPLGASYRDDITLAILKLGESGQLQIMEEKWWRKGKCLDSGSSPGSSTQSLSMERVSGVFAIMAVAILVSVPISGLEYWRSRRRTPPTPAEMLQSVATPFNPDHPILVTPVCTVTEAPECDSPPPPEPHNIVFRNRASFRASHVHRARNTNL